MFPSLGCLFTLLLNSCPSSIPQSTNIENPGATSITPNYLQFQLFVTKPISSKFLISLKVPFPPIIPQPLTGSLAQNNIWAKQKVLVRLLGHGEVKLRIDFYAGHLKAIWLIKLGNEASGKERRIPQRIRSMESPTPTPITHL